MRILISSLMFLFLTAIAAGQESPALTPGAAKSQLDIAHRMLEGGIYLPALDTANAILDDPVAVPQSSSDPLNLDWLLVRENARFVRERARFGLSADRRDFEDVAECFAHLSNNRYRLPEPVYNVQAAYWAGRAYEAIDEYREAVEYFSRVGGLSLPQGMEGDAAQRMSRNLRMLAEEIPYPGTIRDRQRRDRLLNQAIAELDRARLAFPIGNRRKEIELDRIALRMARREEQFVREAASESEAYLDSDPAKDELRARAALFRGQAAAILGNQENAVFWFSKVIDEEQPTIDDRRTARLGLALSLVEVSGAVGLEERTRLLHQANEALTLAIDGTMSPGRWDGARVIKAGVQLDLAEPSAAMETLAPILEGGYASPAAWQVAGNAELRRGRYTDAFNYLYPATRPSNSNREIRYAASRDGSRTAETRRDYGISLALNHQASRILRRDRLFSTLLVSEFLAMETILKLGKMGGPVSLSGDMDLLAADSEAAYFSLPDKRQTEAERLTATLGRLLWHGGDPDAGYDLAIAAESAYEWEEEGIEKLELAIGMISHLRKRQPAGVTDSVLSSRLGEARHALALARADQILHADEPDSAAIDRTLGDFAAAAASFQGASAGGYSLQDSLDQGMVNLESGAFLMQLAEKWERGQFAGMAMTWRDEARGRIEASLRPFNQAIATSGPSSLAARRAKWSRGRALELMQEWRGAAVDYLSLMNNSELPRVLRANAARRWAVCMGKLGESRTALTRLNVFAEIDAEAALLAGHLAEEAGYSREAYGYYVFAANPASPNLPPATAGRIQDSAYHAARLALNNPADANPLLPAEQVVTEVRTLLRESALDDLGGTWTVPILNLLGDSILQDPSGADAAYRLAHTIIERADTPHPVERAMYILAAKARSADGRYDLALDELDSARELLDAGPRSRPDAATIMLETARIYRAQGRMDDALRAYADVFAVYPDQEDADDAARTEAATMLLSADGASEREQEQARGILAGLRDQMLAERIMRDYGIR